MSYKKKNAGDLPYRAMQLPLYEVAREEYVKRFCAPRAAGMRDILPHETMLVGACVGMLAAGVCWLYSGSIQAPRRY
jgi:hypothetical protein